MKIKIHSSELSRMMKVVLPCIDQHDLSNRANIEIRGENDTLIIRATNGVMSSDVRTPYIWGDEESFCVDGQMFAKVVAANAGEVEISTDGKACFVKGAGRTRLPIVNAKIPEGNHISIVDKGVKATKVKAQDFIRCFNGVAYAMSTDQTTRPVLTGVLVEAEANAMRMVSLDGFQMSIDYMPCSGDEFSAIIPGAFMKLVAQSANPDGDICIAVQNNKATAITDDMCITCVLLSGQYPDVKHIMPQDFKINCLTDGSALMNALKGGSVVNSKQNLVKLDISEDTISITSNGDNADYDAEVQCVTTGIERDNTFRIAFNQKYLMNAVNAVGDDNVCLCFNTSVSPCVARKKTDGFGERLVLPVRMMGG